MLWTVGFKEIGRLRCVLIVDELRRGLTLPAARRVEMGGLPTSSEVGEAGKRTGRRRRVEGGSRRLQGCLATSASLSCCSGGLRPNSGEVGCNRRGEEVEEVQEGEENSLVCRNRPGSVGFYRGEEGQRGMGWLIMATTAQWRRGVGGDAALFLTSQGSRRA